MTPSHQTDFFTFSNEMVCVASVQGYFLRVNAAWTKILGWSTEELTSRSFLEFIHPDDRAATVARLEQLAQGLPVLEFENRYRTKEGEYRWLTWYASIDPATKDVVAAARDITAIKAQAESLRISEERLRLVMEATNDAIWDHDLKNNTVWRNETYYQHFGRPPDDLSITWDWWQSQLHPDDMNRVLGSVREALEGTADRWVEEYRLYNGRGELVHVLDRAMIARDAEGQATRMLGAMLDVTEQKNTERELRARAETIRKLFELQEQERKLISHDIYDGLTQMIVGASMHLDAARAIDDPRHAEPLDQARDLLQRAIAESRRLIGDLRPLIIEERGVTASLRHLVADLQARFPRCELFLTTDLQHEHLERDFGGVIYRIVQEALNNALRHGQATQIEVLVEQDETRLLLKIRDNGVGFDPCQVPADRFGLRGIAERARLFGGTATFTSTPGAGTVVTVEMIVPDGVT
jgi:PAS domain S-box-containing protein